MDSPSSQAQIALVGLLLGGWLGGALTALTDARALLGFGGALVLVAGVGVATNAGRLADALVGGFRWFGDRVGRRSRLSPVYIRVVGALTFGIVGAGWLYAAIAD